MRNALEIYCRQDVELQMKLDLLFKIMIAAMIYQSGFYPWREMK